MFEKAELMMTLSWVKWPFQKNEIWTPKFFYEFRKCLKADAHFLSPLNSELGL